MPTEMELTLEQTQQGVSYEVSNIRVISFTMKMEILLELTSNKLMVGDLCDSLRIKLVTTGKKQWCDSFDESDTHVLERFDTSAGNPVKEILLKLNLPDHRILKYGGEVKEFQRSFRHSDTERLSRSDEVLKLKNFKKDATLKLFKSTNQERYEHVGPEVTRSHGGKIYKMAKRDYAWLMISRAAMIRLRAESPSTSHPLPLPSPIVLLHTRASVAMMRVVAPCTYILASRSETPPLGTPQLLPIPLPTPSPPFLLPFTDCRAGVSEVTLPPQKRLCIALGPRFEVGESSSTPTAKPTGGFRADYGFVGTLDDEIRQDPKREVGYGITNTWDEMVEDIQGTPAMTDVAGQSQRMTYFVMTIRQDTDEIYGRLDYA
ncbi:hypothetical protein Tco_0186075 [Tanacetum coccineum]